MDNPTISNVAAAPGDYKDRVDEWVHTLSAAELWSQLNRVSVWFKLAAFAAFIASSFFVVGYFAGSLQINTWDTEQWLHGLILGVPFTATLTMFQYFLYSSGNKNAAYSSALSFVIAAGFGIMTEIGQGMERQENRVHQRSLDSPVLQSALKAIENSNVSLNALPMSTEAAENLAQHQYELTRCNRHLKTHGQWRVDKCVTYEQKRIARYQASVDTQAIQQQQVLSAQAGKTAELMQAAKQLERDEKHYHAFIRFLHSLFGLSSYLSANFLLSLLLVMAFEYAFHYLGNFERDTKAALRLRGYEVKRFRAKPPKQLREESAPLQRTLQNQYMPVQQVGFDPLQFVSQAMAAPAAKKAGKPAAKTARQQQVNTRQSSGQNKQAGQQKNTAAVTASQPTKPQHKHNVFSTYLSKALQTGRANSPQEVKQFLRTTRSPSRSNNTQAAKNKGAVLPQALNVPAHQKRQHCTRTVRMCSPGDAKTTLKAAGDHQPKSTFNSETGTFQASPLVAQKECTRTPPDTLTVNAQTLSESESESAPAHSELKPEQGSLSAALQSESEKLYPLWREQILRQHIKPTFRPGKALLNQHLCQHKRRQTPTPLELDNITRQWFKRALTEQVILKNQQQGRGHARYVVNPAQVMS